jgi:hypothetical protein
MPEGIVRHITLHLESNTLRKSAIQSCVQTQCQTVVPDYMVLRDLVPVGLFDV